MGTSPERELCSLCKGFSVGVRGAKIENCKMQAALPSFVGLLLWGSCVQAEVVVQPDFDNQKVQIRMLEEGGNLCGEAGSLGKILVLALIPGNENQLIRTPDWLLLCYNNTSLTVGTISHVGQF